MLDVRPHRAEVAVTDAKAGVVVKRPAELPLPVPQIGLVLKTGIAQSAG